MERQAVFKSEFTPGHEMTLSLSLGIIIMESVSLCSPGRI